MFTDDSPITEFDARKIYEKQIHPLVEDIRKICILERIPFFITTVVKSDKKSTEYKNDGIMTGSTEIHLADDKFERHLMVCRGAEIKSPIKGILDSEDAMEYIASLPDEEESDDFIEESVDEFVPTEAEIAHPPKDDLSGKTKNNNRQESLEIAQESKSDIESDLGIESVGDI